MTDAQAVPRTALDSRADCLDCGHPAHEMTCHELIPNGDPSNGPAYCPCAVNIDLMEQEILGLRSAAASPTAHSAPPSEALREAEKRLYVLTRLVQIIYDEMPERLNNHTRVNVNAAWGYIGPSRQSSGLTRELEAEFAALASSDRDASPATPDASLAKSWADSLDDVAEYERSKATPDASALRTLLTKWRDAALNDDAATLADLVDETSAALASGDTEPTE